MKSVFWSICLFFYAASSAFAQCNPEDQVESYYDWFKGWENYAIDELMTGFSVADEQRAGDSLHRQMSKEQKLVKRHPKKSYVEGILNRLTPHVKRKGLRYTIHIINDEKTLNAFSIAGGHIYLTAKIINFAQSEDELAMIIAHEIAHIDNKHSVRKVQKLIIGETYIGEDYGLLAANLALMVTAPFGQIDEYDADKSGAVLANKAGYNPRAILRFFKRLAEDEQYDYAEKVFRTHPYSEERHMCLDHFLSNELGK